MTVSHIGARRGGFVRKRTGPVIMAILLTLSSLQPVFAQETGDDTHDGRLDYILAVMDMLKNKLQRRH